MTELLRGTVTFLFTDIEGSTRLVRTLRDRYAEVLGEHERLLRESFDEHGGQVIDTQGDAFFVVFSRAMDAVDAAIKAQRSLAAHQWPENGELRVRMGLHTGEPVVGDGRYMGLGVHRAARICAAGHGGQILLSSVTRELVEDELTDGVVLRDLGEQQLKDMPRAERVFQLEAAGLTQDFPPLRTADLEPFSGREDELGEEAAAAVAPRWYHRRGLLTGALAGVIAAAVAIPIFALAGGSGGGGGSTVSAASVALLDSSGEVVREVGVDGNPGAVAVGEGAVWVTDSSANTVSKINLDSNEVNDTIQVGGGPIAIAVGGGAAWVANGLDGTVSRIDPTGDETRIEVGNAPAGITYGDGAVWVVNGADRTVSKIDPEQLAVVGKPLPAGAAGPGIAVGAGAVWVTDQGSNTVARIDIASRTRRPLSVGNGPTGIAFSDGAVWVANTLDGTVSRIDASTNSTGALTTVGSDPTGVAVAAESVWVANEFDGTVARLDPATGGLVDEVPTGGRPAGLAASGDSVWVSAAAAAASHRGGTLRVTYLGVDETIDPALSLDGVLSMTNDGLVAFRRTGGSEGMQLVPDLATSLPAPTDGGRTYTFQVRSGVRYSDGTLVQASDFRWAIERGLRLGDSLGGYFEGLVGAGECGKRRCDLSRGIVVDDTARTVTFRLTAPDPDFFYKLALPPAYAVPKTVGPQEAKRPVPATGPYMIERHRPGRLLLVRNPRFRPWSHAAQPGGYPDVIAEGPADDSEATEAVVSGAADIATPPPEALSTLRVRDPGQLYVNSLPQIWAFALNTRVPPFDRLDVRRALNYAIDRAAVTRLAGGAATARPTCQILPANFQGYTRYCPYRYDLAKARDLVARSGNRGTVVNVWTTPAQSGWLEVGQHAVSVLKRLGYRASLKPVTNPDRYFQDVVFKPRRQVQIAMFAWQANWPSDFFLPNFGCDSFENAKRFCDPAVDEAMRRALRVQASDPLAANALWAGVDRQIVDAAAWVPLVNPAGVSIVSKRVGNFQYNPMWGVLLDQLWVK